MELASKKKAGCVKLIVSCFQLKPVLTSKYLLLSLTKKRRKMGIFKKLTRKIDKKLAKYPAYVKFLKFRDKVAECILVALLAFFSAVGPVWNFLFVKTPNPYENETS